MSTAIRRRVPLAIAAVALVVMAAMSRQAAADELIPSRLSEWIELPPPEAAPREDIELSNRKHIWNLKLGSDGTIRVEPKPEDNDEKQPYPLPFRRPELDTEEGLNALRVADGWLVSRDQGEWGGDVRWYSADGKRTYVIEAMNLTNPGAFFRFGDAICMFVHDDGWIGKRGLLLQLDHGKEGRWVTKTSVALKGDPASRCFGADGKLLVATRNGRLLRVDRQGNVDVLQEKQFWGEFRPVSILEKSPTEILIGAHSGVARIRRVGSEWVSTWLVPNQEFANPTPTDNEWR